VAKPLKFKNHGNKYAQPLDRSYVFPLLSQYLSSVCASFPQIGSDFWPGVSNPRPLGAKLHHFGADQAVIERLVALAVGGATQGETRRHSRSLRALSHTLSGFIQHTVIFMQLAPTTVRS